jgi:hypothetical protein
MKSKLFTGGKTLILNTFCLREYCSRGGKRLILEIILLYLKPSNKEVNI